MVKSIANGNLNYDTFVHHHYSFAYPGMYLNKGATKGDTWIRIKELFTNKKFILAVWILIACISSIKQTVIGSYNNYLIFKYTFIHAWQHVNIYLTYPE